MGGNERRHTEPIRMTQNDIPSQDPALDADLETQLRDEIEALKGEIEQLRMDSLRERADLDNQRKRVARDIEQARRFANEKLLGELLPVFDSLDAGLAAAVDQSGPLKDGMELTYRQLLKVAADNGLSVVDPAGQPFNPDHHQAISQAEAGDAAPGSVVQVFQKGYVLNERLLRPALVVVARHD
jgi:molecular chaperone GrpE